MASVEVLTSGENSLIKWKQSRLVHIPYSGDCIKKWQATGWSFESFSKLESEIAQDYGVVVFSAIAYDNQIPKTPEEFEEDKEKERAEQLRKENAEKAKNQSWCIVM